MKISSLVSLFWLALLSLAGCTPLSWMGQPTQIPAATAPTTPTSILAPAATVSLAPATASPTITPTPLDTLEPAQASETIQPLLTEPMNCAVPCFWGIIPGKTSFGEARGFFSRLGFVPFEGMDRNSPSSGMYFYTISYNSGSDHDSSVTLFISDDRVQNIIVDPDIPTPKQGSRREWTAYSPDTLIKRYGSPSSVRFAVSSYGLAGSPPNISIDMIMYFDASDLIVHYTGYDMTPNWFCPLTAPFDFVRLWMGHNPPHTPLFETVPLEKATSLSMEQFTQLMQSNPKKACFPLKSEAFP